MTEIHLLAPVPGTCPLCGAKHRRNEPHDERSAYFRMVMRRRERKSKTKPEKTGE